MDPTIDPTNDPTIDPTNNPSNAPSARPSTAPTPAPKLQANTDKPTFGNGEVINDQNNTQAPINSGEDDGQVLDTSTLIIIGSIAGICIICCLILILFGYHRKNQRLQAKLALKHVELGTATPRGTDTLKEPSSKSYQIKVDSPKKNGALEGKDRKSTNPRAEGFMKKKSAAAKSMTVDSKASEFIIQTRQGTVNSAISSIVIDGSSSDESDWRRTW